MVVLTFEYMFVQYFLTNINRSCNDKGSSACRLLCKDTPNQKFKLDLNEMFTAKFDELGGRLRARTTRMHSSEQHLGLSTKVAFQICVAALRTTYQRVTD